MAQICFPQHKVKDLRVILLVKCEMLCEYSWIYLHHTHLLLGCSDLVVVSSGSFSQLSASCGCCTSRWMWLGEEGHGEAAEEPWAGESWEEGEDEDGPLWQSSSDKFSVKEATSCCRSLIRSRTLSRAEKTSSSDNSRPTWETKKKCSPIWCILSLWHWRCSGLRGTILPTAFSEMQKYRLFPDNFSNKLLLLFLLGKFLFNFDPNALFHNSATITSEKINGSCRRWLCSFNQFSN